MRMNIDAKIRQLEVVRDRILHTKDLEEIHTIITYQLFPIIIDPLVYPEFKRRSHYFIDLTDSEEGEMWNELVSVAHNIHRDFEIIKKAIDLTKLDFSYNEADFNVIKQEEWSIEEFLELFEHRSDFSFCQSCMSFGWTEPRKIYRRYQGLISLLEIALEKQLLSGESKEAYHSIRRSMHKINEIIMLPIHLWHTDEFDCIWGYIYTPGFSNDLPHPHSWAPIVCDDLAIYLEELKSDKRKIARLQADNVSIKIDSTYLEVDDDISFSSTHSIIAYSDDSGIWKPIKLSTKESQAFSRFLARSEEIGNRRSIKNIDLATLMDISQQNASNILSRLRKKCMVTRKEVLVQVADNAWSLNQKFTCFNKNLTKA